MFISGKIFGFVISKITIFIVISLLEQNCAKWYDLKIFLK